MATQAAARICSFYDGKLQKALEDGRRLWLWLSRVWALYWYASHSLTAPARVPQFTADGHLYSTESSPHILTCQSTSVVVGVCLPAIAPQFSCKYPFSAAAEPRGACFHLPPPAHVLQQCFLDWLSLNSQLDPWVAALLTTTEGTHRQSSSPGNLPATSLPPLLLYCF